MILRRSSYYGEMTISDDSEPDYLNFNNDTNKVTPFCPSVRPCLYFPWKKNRNHSWNSLVVLYLNMEFEELGLVPASSEVTGKHTYLELDLTEGTIPSHDRYETVDRLHRPTNPKWNLRVYIVVWWPLWYRRWSYRLTSKQIYFFI